MIGAVSSPRLLKICTVVQLAISTMNIDIKFVLKYQIFVIKKKTKIEVSNIQTINLKNKKRKHVASNIMDNL